MNVSNKKKKFIKRHYHLLSEVELSKKLCLTHRDVRSLIHELGLKGKKQIEKEKQRSAGISKKYPFFAIVAISLVVMVIYSNTLNVPFYFDDRPGITENYHIQIRELSLSRVKDAAFGGPYYRRPLANITFAVNHLISGLDVFGYHFVNIIIHIFAGIGVFYLVLITLNLALSLKTYESYHYSPGINYQASHIPYLAFFTAIIWVVHPIQTQAVTYILQRMDSMASMFYIWSLVFYLKFRIQKSEIRIQNNSKSKKLPFYYTLSLLFFLLSLGTKEISTTLPFIILVYEFLFFGGLKGLKDNGWKYVVIFLVISIICGFLYIGGLSGLVGTYENFTAPHMPIREFSGIERVITQFRVFIFYISLILFPHPSRLNLEHDFLISHSLFDPPTTLIYLLLIVIALGYAFYCIRRMPLYSLCIFWFFINLLIESSFLNLELVFEHRLYLPSVGIILLFVIVIWRGMVLKKFKYIIVALLSFLIILFCFYTYDRNQLWGDKLLFFKDAIRKSPQTVRLLYNLGLFLFEMGRIDEALKHYQKAIELQPNYPGLYNNLGVALANKEKFDEAIKHFQQAIELNPTSVEAHTNIGAALAKKGEFNEAIKHFHAALKLEPTDAEAHTNLGNTLCEIGRFDEAIKHYHKAIKLKPNDAEVHNNIGKVLADIGRFDEAIKHYNKALKLQPNLGVVHNNIRAALAKKGEFDEAIEHYYNVLKLKPKDAIAHNKLGVALAKKGEFDEAIKHFQEAIKIEENYVDAHYNMANVLLSNGKVDEAINHFHQALKIKPDFKETQRNLYIAKELLKKQK